MNYGVILDCILVFVIIFFAIVSAKRGFLKTIIEIVGFFAAIWIAFSFSTPLANFTYETFIENKVNESVSDKLNESKTDFKESAEKCLPDFILNGAKMLRVDFNSVNTSGGVDETAKSVSDTVARPVIISIIRFIYSGIIFAIVTFLVRLFARTTRIVSKIPIVGGLNRFLGGIIGIIKGLLIAFVFCFIISNIVALTDNGFLIFTKEAINSSSVFKYLAGFNPLFYF